MNPRIHAAFASILSAFVPVAQNFDIFFGAGKQALVQLARNNFQNKRRNRNDIQQVK